METISLVQKEAKTLKFTVKDASGTVVNCSSATCSLYCKTNMSDSTYVFSKTDVDFNKSQASSGIIKVGLTTSNLNFVGKKYLLLMLSFSATNVDKTYFEIILTNSAE